MRKFLLALLVLIPLSVSAQTIIIRPGDTLSKLAAKYNTTVSNLASINNIKNPDLIYAGAPLQLDGLVGGTPLPSDNYDSYLTSALSASATTTFVNALPTGITESVYTIFAQDGITPREKIYCTGTASSPNKLTFCTRGVSFSPSSGVINENAGTGLSHSKNARIAITDNINFSGKALSILFGNQETGSSIFLIGANSTTGLKFNAGDYRTIALGQTGSPFVRFNSSTGRWQFSDDGTNTTNFATSSAAGLSASTTAGIGITNSLIHIIASTTQGMAFGSDGRLYVKTSSTLGVYADSNGISINTSTLSALFTSFSNAATTTPTANKIPLATSAGTITSTWIATSSAAGTRAVLRNNTSGAGWDTLKTYSGNFSFSASGALTSTIGFEPRTINFHCSGQSGSGSWNTSLTSGYWTASGTQYAIGTIGTSGSTATDLNSSGLIGENAGGGGASYNVLSVALTATSTSGFTLTATKSNSPGNIYCVYTAYEF